MNYDRMYEKRELWQEYKAEGLVKQKIPIILDWIAADVKSILDVGCGNGFITNLLAEKYEVTGVDSSASALEFVKGNKIEASAAEIPCADLSFDMVFSSEMLEHLPDQVLAATMDHFKRISRKYIFITVPNDEYLPKLHTKCPQCSHVFHVYGHIQSFDPHRLDALVGDDFRRVRTGTYGPSEQQYHPALLHIRQHQAGQWFQTSEYTVCPQCGNSVFPEPKVSILSKVCNGLNRAVSSTKPYWLFTMYERKAG